MVCSLTVVDWDGDEVPCVLGPEGGTSAKMRCLASGDTISEGEYKVVVVDTADAMIYECDSYGVLAGGRSIHERQTEVD